MSTMFAPASGPVVSDTFNRADNTSLGNAETGQTWSGDFGIAGNKAYGKLSTNAFALVNSGIADCDISLVMSTYYSDSYSGAIARYTNADNYLSFELNAGAVYIKKRESGSSSNLTYVSGKTFSNGDVFKMRVSGTSISVYQNGALLVSTTSTLNQTATTHGLRTYQTTARFDDFKVEAI